MGKNKKKPAIKRTRVEKNRGLGRTALIVGGVILIIAAISIGAFCFFFRGKGEKGKKVANTEHNGETVSSATENSEPEKQIKEEIRDEKKADTDENEVLEEEEPEQQSAQQEAESDYINKAKELTAAMSLEEKLNQLFIVNLDAMVNSNISDENEKVAGANIFGDKSKAAFEAYPVGGLVLNSDNLLNQEEIDQSGEPHGFKTIADDFQKLQIEENVPAFLAVSSSDIEDTLYLDVTAVIDDNVLASDYGINMVLEIEGQNYVEITDEDMNGEVIIVQRDFTLGNYKVADGALRLYIMETVGDIDGVVEALCGSNDMIICTDSEFDLKTVISELNDKVKTEKLTENQIDEKVVKVLCEKMSLGHKSPSSEKEETVTETES